MARSHGKSLFNRHHYGSHLNQAPGGNPQWQAPTACPISSLYLCTWWRALSQTLDPLYMLDVGFGLGNHQAGSQLDSALRAPGGRLGEVTGFSPTVCVLFLFLPGRGP